MTLKEAKMTIYENVVYACEEAGFSPVTIKMVKDACDTVIELAEQADTPQTEEYDFRDEQEYNDRWDCPWKSGGDMKRLITIVLMAVMMLSLSACGTKQTSEVVKGETSRMVYVEETSRFCIVYDKYTKVMYAVSNSGYNYGNFTLLVDANGNPLLYEK